MALEIINSKIVGTIDNLEEKLDGKLPITREELIYLVNSWGRKFDFYTKASNDQTLIIDICESKECYDLSKLDVSQITNMGNLFTLSLFDGDVSKWNTSNVTSMVWMFSYAKSFNQELNFDTSKVTSMNSMFCNAEKFNQELNFDTSNVTSMISMFSYAKSFNQPLNFDTSSVTNMDYMFDKALAFENKYNSGRSLPNYTNEIKDWLNDNRDRMNAIDIKDQHGEDIDDFFSNITDIYSTNRIGLHNNIHSLPISIP